MREGVSYRVVTARDMTPVVVSIDGGGGWRTGSEHSGEEFLVVLEGCVDIRIDGRRRRLYAGDSTLIHRNVTHALRNPSREPAMLIAVVDNPRAKKQTRNTRRGAESR